MRKCTLRNVSLMFCASLFLSACLGGKDETEIPEDLCGIPVNSSSIEPLLPESGDVRISGEGRAGRFASLCRVMVDNVMALRVSVHFDNGEMDAVATARKPPYEFSAVREAASGFAIGREGAFVSIPCQANVIEEGSTHLNGEIALHLDELYAKNDTSNMEKFAQEYFDALKVDIGCA